MELQSLKQRYGIIGNSPGLNYALSIAVRVAPTNLTVLITGESGVGKEVFSNIIHTLSPRKHNPFIAVNCGAIPEGTIDSELFGHEKGSFTGAHEARKGYFEYVQGGTIFLDEIGEMPLGTQARLLRVLETGEFIRVGSSKVQKTDVRVIAATNIDLMERIKKNRFREDLYYRLSTVPIHVPPLRERKEDIHFLFRKFAADFADKHKTSPVQLDDEAVRVLENYPWHGNIRELKNIAEQVSVLAKDKLVTANELLRFMPDTGKSRLPAISERLEDGGAFTERELLYKLFFDMKKDLNEMKKFIYQVAQKGELGNITPPSSILPSEHYEDTETEDVDVSQPIIIHKNNGGITEAEVEEEENLSIAEKEKELITKALKKYKGKRKVAAQELGISERTLYRKIKEYGLEE